MSNDAVVYETNIIRDARFQDQIILQASRGSLKGVFMTRRELYYYHSAFGECVELEALKFCTRRRSITWLKKFWN